MKNSLFPKILVAAATITAAVGAVDTAAQDSLELPFRKTLSARRGTIRLHDARLIIRCNEDTPTLEIRAIDPETVNSAAVTVAERGDGFEVAAPDPASDLREIIMELTAPSDLPLVVEGRDLRVERICNLPDGDISTVNPKDPGATTSFSVFRLDDGSIDFQGPDPARFETDGTSVTVSLTRGPLVFMTSGGTVTITGHEGTIEIESNDTIFSIEDVRGDVTATVSRGQLNLTGIDGTTTLGADQSSLDVAELDGNLQISGAGNALSLRNSAMQNFRLEGTDLSAQIDDCSGTGVVTVTGGSLEADRWSGRLTLQAARGTDSDLSRLDADLVLDFTDDSSCSVRGVTGHIHGTVENGTLTASQIKSIELSSVSSEISITEIRETTSLDLTDSGLEYSSTVLTGNPEIRLSGTSEARVDLPVPCKVQLMGPGKNNSNVEVQGCNLHRGRIPASQLRKKKWETRRPIIMTVTLDPDARLRIDGRPY